MCPTVHSHIERKSISAAGAMRCDVEKWHDSNPAECTPVVWMYRAIVKIYNNKSENV